MTRRLWMAGRLWQRVIDDCRHRLPEEACGLLIGRVDDAGWHVFRACPSRNIAGNPRRHFEIDPLLRLKLEKELRTGPFCVTGHYHGHPNGLAEPSAADRAAIVEKHLLWLIAAPGSSGMMEMTAWRPLGNGFAPVPVILTADAGKWEEDAGYEFRQ